MQTLNENLLSRCLQSSSISDDKMARIHQDDVLRMDYEGFDLQVNSVDTVHESSSGRCEVPWQV